MEVENPFPPERCNAWDDCQHDGLCHDPSGCGAVGPNMLEEDESADDPDTTILLQSQIEPHGEYLNDIFERAVTAAAKAMIRFPQPNYVLTKVAEEAGEVVKAGVHYAEGRDFTWEDLEGECIQTIAMCFRLLIEGDQVHGVRSPYAESN